MSFEIEHAPGTSMTEIKIAEAEFRKNQLAKQFGWTREKLDEQLQDIKSFFELNKKKILKRE